MGYVIDRNGRDGGSVGRRRRGDDDLHDDWSAGGGDTGEGGAGWKETVEALGEVVGGGGGRAIRLKRSIFDGN